MGELDLVRSIRKWTAGKAPGLIVGVGDDSAIIRPRAREDVVLTTDLFLEDSHFKRDTHSAADCGWKALARALSDIASMGASPRFALVSLALPPWVDRKWIRGFYRGMTALASRYGVRIVGGDLSKAGKLACDVVVTGAVPTGQALRRSGAKPGDRIVVTGTLGGSSLGFETAKGPALRRHLRPEPRIEAGEAIRSKLGATACMDLSDGLAMDLHRLGKESGVAGHLHWALPLFPGASLRQALMGGEDYELLFTVPPSVKLPPVIAGIPLTDIGEMRKGRAGYVTFAGRPLPVSGWDPFKTRSV
jgi:thiamine-monophosphate kinase